MNIDKNKIIIFTICIILMLSGFTLILHYTSKTNHINTILQEGIFKINNNNILKLTYNNTTIYMYDNNLTVIKNITNLEKNSYSNLINVKPFTSLTGYEEFYFDAITNIPLSSLPQNPQYPRPSAQNNNNMIKGLMTSANSTIYFNYTILTFISSSISYTGTSIFNVPSGYTGLVNFRFFNTAIYYFNSQNVLTTVNVPNLNFSNNFFSNIGNLSTFLITLNFPLGNHLFVLSIFNYLSEGNLTLTNTTGYYNLINLKTGQGQSLILLNGSYSYSFQYTYINSTDYINGTFNITGNSYQLILNTGIGNLLIEYLSLFFLIINILTLAIIYYISKNYYLLIPDQMLFFVIGYEYKIQYYTFYFVLLSVFLLSMFISIKIMGKIENGSVEQ